MSHSVLIATSEYPFAFMPSLKPTNSASSTSRFFLPIARRSRSALPSVYPASFCAIAMTCSWYTIRPYVVPRIVLQRLRELAGGSA